MQKTGPGTSIAHTHRHDCSGDNKIVINFFHLHIIACKSRHSMNMQKYTKISMRSKRDVVVDLLRLCQSFETRTLIYSCNLHPQPSPQPSLSSIRDPFVRSSTWLDMVMRLPNV